VALNKKKSKVKMQRAKGKSGFVSGYAAASTARRESLSAEGAIKSAKPPDYF
jgi:hypothetical protein